MKDGRIEDETLAKDATIERLAGAVVGDKEFKDSGAALSPVRDEEVLSLVGIRADNDKGLPALKDISLKIRAGEIFGIAGVAGNGQRELAEAVAGLRKVTAGTIKLNGLDITKTDVKRRIREGISFVPEDRLHMGLAAGMD